MSRLIMSPLLHVLSALLFLAIAGIAVTPARAAPLATTYTVTKTADTNDGACNSDCSLREAVLAANASPGADTIVVPAGTYNLTRTGPDEEGGSTGDLDLRDTVTITGAGAGSTIIDGQASDRVFHIGLRIVVTISGVTVRNGALNTILSDCGGGILSYGTLTLNDSVVSGNQAPSKWGGGICNLRVLNMNRSTVTGNSSTYGGGIYSEGSNLQSGVGVTVYSSTLSGNQATYGGGIYNMNGTADMTATVVLNNNATMGGGGIDNDIGGKLTLFGSTVRENTSGEEGGGIYIGNTNYVTVTASAILSNTVTSETHQTLGGGVFNASNLAVINSTISGNSAYAGNSCTAAGCQFNLVSMGGGIFQATNATLINSTLNNNSATYRTALNQYSADKGAALYNGGFTHAKNTIIANSRGYNNAEAGNCAWLAVQSWGHNLDSGYTCGLADPTDKVSIDPLIGSLKTYASAPPVYTLQSGSPAIDAGDNTDCPTVDERGFPRPFDGDANGTATCDLGAFEVGSYTASVALASSANPSVVGQSVTLTATLSPSVGTQTGTVTFKDGTAAICPAVPVVGGKATCAFAFSGAGAHSITAVYSGDDKFSSSTSNVGGQTVNKAGTTTTVSSHTPDSTKAGQSVTVNYAVVVNAPGSATPSGNVTVSDGVGSCTASAAAGSCTLTLSTVGTRSLTATYAGDANLLGSASAPVSHSVSAGSSAPPGTFKVYLPLVIR